MKSDVVWCFSVMTWTNISSLQIGFQFHPQGKKIHSCLHWWIRGCIGVPYRRIVKSYPWSKAPALLTCLPGMGDNSQKLSLWWYLHVLQAAQPTRESPSSTAFHSFNNLGRCHVNLVIFRSSWALWISFNSFIIWSSFLHPKGSVSIQRKTTQQEPDNPDVSSTLLLWLQIRGRRVEF